MDTTTWFWSRATDVISGTETISAAGSDWLWAVTAIYILAFIGLLGICFTVTETDRVFHYMFTAILLVGSITYYAEASNIGWSGIEQVNELDNGHSRQVFYAKYINWAVSFPTIALGLGLLSGVSWTTILSNIFFSWFWVLAYLAAAFTTTEHKWGFFAFGTLAWLVLAMSTINESHEAAALHGIGRDYRLLSVFVNALWVLYPIAFGLSDGGNVIGVTGSLIFFGVLDVMMVPFAFFFLFLARKWNYARLHLAFSEHRFDLRGNLEQSGQPEGVMKAPSEP